MRVPVQSRLISCSSLLLSELQIHEIHSKIAQTYSFHFYKYIFHPKSLLPLTHPCEKHCLWPFWFVVREFPLKCFQKSQPEQFQKNQEAAPMVTISHKFRDL